MKVLNSSSQRAFIAGIAGAALLAIFALSCSSNDNPSSGGTTRDPAPMAPANVRIVIVSKSRVIVNWTQSAKISFKGFVLQRSTETSDWREIARPPASVRSYTDSGLQLQTYSYRVQSYNDAGSSRFSLSATANVKSYIVPPGPIRLVSDSILGTVEISWRDNSGNADGYVIKRTRTDDPTDIFIDSVTDNSLSYIDVDAPCGTQLTYRIRAYNQTDTSYYSGALTVVTPFAFTSLQACPVRSDLYSVSVADYMSAVIVGQTGVILRTDDGGMTWVKLRVTSSSDLNAVFCVSPDEFYIAGKSGNLYKTIDAGESFISLTTGKSSTLKTIYFRSHDTGFVAGTSGVLLMTTNAGVNWKALTSGSSKDLNAISFATPSIGFIVGAAGTLIKTYNGGASWAPVSGTAFAGTTLNDISFASDSSGVIVGGGNGKIYTTTDQGRNWTSQQGASTNGMNSVTSLGKLDAIAVGEYGTMQYTASAGLIWKQQMTPAGSVEFHAIDVLEDGTGFIVGNDGTIVRLDGCSQDGARAHRRFFR